MNFIFDTVSILKKNVSSSLQAAEEGCREAPGSGGEERPRRWILGPAAAANQRRTLESRSSEGP